MISFGSYLSVKPSEPQVAIITDERVKILYGERLQKQLGAHLFSIPCGEAFKTRAQKERIEDLMFEKKLGRDTCVIGLGGGVVTDLAGFIAATYCRGVPLLLIPTTLLAMVDSSIGGKNGVNTPAGKNLIGTFYPPEQILVDLTFLETLPERELECGKVEMIKHALIGDAAYLEGLDIDKKSIQRSIAIKQEIVESDPRELGRRRLLNFGHTIGHALEMHLQIPHGEAVAMGLRVESILSHNLGYLSPASFEKILHSLRAYPHYPAAYEDLEKYLNLDKKGIAKQPRFVLLQEIGLPLVFGGDYCTTVSESEVKRALCSVSPSLAPH